METKLNNFSTKINTGDKIKYYRFPKNLEKQQEYQKTQKTTGINSVKGHIFSEYWSKY